MGKSDVITIKDVAKKAGVSVATAGRALGNYGKISLETREKVLAAADELNYVPNKMAQSMRSRSTRTLGIIIPDVQNRFFGEILGSMEKRAREKDYALLICNSGEKREQELECLDMLTSKQVDGILLGSAFVDVKEIPEKYLKTIRRNVPCVLFDRNIEGLKTVSILTDNYKTCYEATKYLIGLGHTHIATIGSEKDGKVSNTVKEREAGYRTALRESGVTNGGLSINVDWQKGLDMEKKINILFDYHKITAVIILNNSLFGGLLRVIRKRNMKVPEDLSVITWDDEDYDEFLDITAVRQPTMKIGELAVDNVIEQIESPEKRTDTITITLDSKLIIRNSCRINRAI